MHFFYCKVAIKYRKIMENLGVVLMLVMMLENICRGQGTFPNLVIAAVLIKNTNKISEKLEGSAKCW